MENLKQLPASSEPVHLPYDNIGKATKKTPFWQRAERHFGVRLCFLALFLTGLGIYLGYRYLPALPANTAISVIEAHIPKTHTSYVRVFINLLFPCLPELMMLFAVGFTGFSKTVITGILCLHSLSDGITLGYLFLLSRGSWNDLSFSFAHRHIIGFGTTVILLGGIRLVISLSARYTAKRYLKLIQPAPPAFHLLMRHLTIFLLYLGGYVLVLAGYTVFLFTLV